MPPFPILQTPTPSPSFSLYRFSPLDPLHNTHTPFVLPILPILYFLLVLICICAVFCTLTPSHPTHTSTATNLPNPGLSGIGCAGGLGVGFYEHRLSWGGVYSFFLLLCLSNTHVPRSKTEHVLSSLLYSHPRRFCPIRTQWKIPKCRKMEK